MPYNVAVIGATGNVGREILNILAERQFPIHTIKALASGRSHGTEVSFGDRVIRVEALEHADLSQVQLVLMSAGSQVAEQWADRLAANGAIVIDNSSHFRMFSDVPLIVPEVNAHALAAVRKRGIIANPNCSTIQLVVALNPLHQLSRLKRVVVSTYQSTSGAGKRAMDELFGQTRAIFSAQAVKEVAFTKRIAFNLIPHIDRFMEDGFTREEWKLNVETKKILDPDLRVVATCVRVPVFVSHAEAVCAEFESPITYEDAQRALYEAPGLLLLDRREDGAYATPYDVAGEDAVYVSRLREDHSVANGLAFWCVADNLRKGAALNAVQIAECLVDQKLIPNDRGGAV